ncbi:MBL fold metallo-hydrolase [Arvimicrobium flavum]|uniref:MBL fold metallo-hydrolase n=1 Tax=Arvimicrobium flavum TaxID=3393320 RepID=UPI00237B8CB8|nr:MBL fold metallo-hydrolase [Mesorhizobium shangrilense]
MAKRESKPKGARSKTGAAAPSPAATAAAAARATPPALTVRHYCQGIGDCHLLTFFKDDGRPFRMLIDCGIHSSVSGGSDLIDAIATDIRDVTGRSIDVLVVTHEHWDHVSGFSTAGEIFQSIPVGEVWMAWTEDPDDADAREFDMFRAQAVSALQGASRRMEAAGETSFHMFSLGKGLQSVLGFQFGAKGEKVRAARDAAARLGTTQPPRYLEPSAAPITLPGVPNLKVYVLGPPRDRKLLRLEEKADEMFPLADLKGWALGRMLAAGLAASAGEVGPLPGEDAPFDYNIGTPLADALNGHAGAISDFVNRHYSGPVPQPEPPAERKRAKRVVDQNLLDQSWRRIDADWLGIAADLALQLDRGVNNTSLVLAFEIGSAGRVFLFPGDAQIGNWLSWKDVSWPVDTGTVTAADLLARTVYLKVAHHGSHNATPRRNGLDLITARDLSAFVPVSEESARKVGWSEMPFQSILTALASKTSGRVVRADDPWIGASGGVPGFTTPSGSILAVRSGVIKGSAARWVEFDLA